MERSERLKYRYQNQTINPDSGITFGEDERNKQRNRNINTKWVHSNSKTMRVKRR